ncbi:sorting nexin-33 isoform X2 [Chanos chanos]|uniref:Sorting nexin-33 isoform X2 n=1 Tax=Chanos chanos TaxID=29144 RepID=A0A6J2VQ35_CHACN|nr:sorting nexin-33 isoform X2 [Chanos chanos]
MSLKAKALYTFQSENKEEISIQENEELIIFDENSLDGWLQGENSRGERGLFPASYVEIIRPRSNSNLTDCSLSPAGSPGNDSSYFPSAPNTPYHMQQTYYDDDDDDWDDWDDSSTVVEDDDPGRGVGSNGHAHQSQYSNPNVHYRPKPHMERQDSISSSRKGSMVGRNLNRFSSFVRSGVEAFVLGDVPMMAKIAESYTIEMGPQGPQWKENPQPFTCSIEDPTKQTKFKGIKTYISYRVTPSHTTRPVYRRYKHFDWLYNRLLHKFTVISVPHLPEKQATGRFEEDFIEKRKRRLILWMNHMTSHPVLSQYEGFEHFLMCGDDKQWKLGKRRAEKDEMVGAHFMLTFQIPSEHQDLQDVEERIDSFKAFAKKMDDSVMQLTHVASELGLLSNFPDIIHLQKGAFAKVKESQRMSDEGKMDQEEADGIRKRCRTVGFALQAEMNHFHRRREVDFKEMMQAYLRQQIAFYQRVGQQLERTLRMYDNL